MKIEAVKKTYHGKTVLDIASFEFSDKLIYAVVGANGSGKSTLLKLLAGMIEPDEGASIENKGMKILYMPQKSFAFKMSLKRNLLLGIKKTEEAQKKAGELMEKLEMSGLKKNRADRFSGGECEKLALARLLMRKADLLLLDEPTSAMDAHSTLAAEELIKSYCHENACTAVIVTHSLKQAERLCDEMVFIENGRILESAPASELVASPKCSATKQFLDFYGA